MKDVHKLEYKSRIKIVINFQMQYYYSEHDSYLCFVKGYSIPFVLVPWLCPIFLFYLFIILKEGHNWTHMQKYPAHVRYGYNTLNEVSVFSN